MLLNNYPSHVHVFPPTFLDFYSRTFCLCPRLEELPTNVEDKGVVPLFIKYPRLITI
jgi:hypothetical protein